MAINDQISDGKLQYDINREAVKMFALSSGKIRKYEYLTNEDILQSNQQQIIEQAKFTYSRLGKAFEKQIKTIEDQGEKQVDALKDLKPISKKMYAEILEKRSDEILKISRKVNYSHLVYDFKGPTPSINFPIFGSPMYTYNQLRNREKKLQQVEEQKKYLKKDLNKIEKHKSEKQSYKIKNVSDLYDTRQKIINLLNNNAKIRFEAIYKLKQHELKEQGLKY